MIFTSLCRITLHSFSQNTCEQQEIDNSSITDMVFAVGFDAKCTMVVRLEALQFNNSNSVTKYALNVIIYKDKK